MPSVAGGNWTQRFRKEETMASLTLMEKAGKKGNTDNAVRERDMGRGTHPESTQPTATLTGLPLPLGP